MTKVSSAEKVGMSSERLERIGESMRSLIDSNKIPGTVTLVARKGKVVHFEANGSRDIERDQPMKKDTIFRIYSQSKPITGAALMMLFEEGKFFYQLTKLQNIYLNSRTCKFLQKGKVVELKLSLQIQQ